MNNNELKRIYELAVSKGLTTREKLTIANFSKAMGNADFRRKFFDKNKTTLSLGNNFNTFEKKIMGTTTVGNGENIKKLIAIDDDIEETTSPNQGVKVVKTKDGDRIRIFFNDGRYVSRKNLNNINDKTDEITGIWYFVGGDNYQIKYYNNNKTEVYDFKAKNIIKVSDKPFTPPSTQTTTGVKLDLQKLIGIDEVIKKTASPDQAIARSSGDDIFIFYSDGNFRLRFSSVNNKVGEIPGRWKFLGNDSYQINTSDGDVYIYPTGWKGVPTTSETTGGKSDLQKLMKIDSTIKKTTSPNQAIFRFTDTNDNRKIVWIFFSDGNWKQRINSVNNKVNEAIGKWYFTDNEKNYQIKSETYGDTFDFKTQKWVKPNSPSKTWKEVTFTLEDVLAGKAVLKRGMKGKAVEDLQKLMIDMNLSKVSKTGKPDGKFGKLTELSIKQFQGEMRHGEQDGKVGERTLKRMYYVYNYDPDKEVDDEQPQVPATSDKYSPQGVPDDALKPQTPIDGETSTTPQAVPDTTTQPKKKLTLSPINEQENNEE